MSGPEGVDVDPRKDESLPDEEQILAELYGAPNADGIYDGAPLYEESYE